MLEGLDKIPWRKLRHAYGPASDTPRAIRALASSSAKKRAKAIDNLSFSIVHQGSVYEAAAKAVPFFAELLRSPVVQDKHAILDLLFDMAVGHGWHQNHQSLDIVRQTFGEEKIEREKERESKFVTELRAGIDAHVADYLPLLDHADPRVRMQTARLLTAVRGEPAASAARQAMRAALAKEADASVRANLVLALVYHSGRAASDAVEEVFAHENNAVPLIAAAVALLLSRPDAPPPDAVRVLVDALAKRDESVEQQYNELPISNGFLGDVTMVLGLADVATRRAIAETLVQRLESLAPHPTVHFAAHALGVILSDDLRGSAETAYSPLQNRAIAAVARAAFPNANSIYVNYVEVLEAYKLGPRPSDIDRLLGTTDWRGYPVPPASTPRKRSWWRLW